MWPTFALVVLCLSRDLQSVVVFLARGREREGNVSTRGRLLFHTWVCLSVSVCVCVCVGVRMRYMCVRDTRDLFVSLNSSCHPSCTSKPSQFPHNPISRTDNESSISAREKYAVPSKLW